MLPACERRPAYVKCWGLHRSVTVRGDTGLCGVAGGWQSRGAVYPGLIVTA